MTDRDEAIMSNPLLRIGESQLQAAIIELAKHLGWMVFHPMPVQNQAGRWRTAQQGDRGFPDLVLAHRELGVIFVELKSTIGRISDYQQLWIDTLRQAGAEVYVWRPIDIAQARKILTEGAPK